MNPAWAVVLSLALQAPPPPPPTPPQDRPLTHLVQNLWHDLRALPTLSTARILLVGSGGALTATFADHRLSDWSDGRGASSYTTVGRKLGDGWFQGGAAVATFAVGKIAKHELVAHVGSDLIRAQVLNGALTTGLKLMTTRVRPSGSRHAFPSGHASAAFASAAVLDAHFGWRVGVPAYAAAGFIGWTRVRDRQHWLSDVVFGGTIGIIAGRTTTAGHRRAWTIVPVRTNGGFALYFVRTPR